MSRSKLDQYILDNYDYINQSWDDFIKNISNDRQYVHPTSDGLNRIAHELRRDYQYHTRRFGRLTKKSWARYVPWYVEHYNHPDNDFLDYWQIFFEENAA